MELTPLHHLKLKITKNMYAYYLNVQLAVLPLQSISYRQVYKTISMLFTSVTSLFRIMLRLRVVIYLFRLKNSHFF